jgi:hypothetical protein
MPQPPFMPQPQFMPQPPHHHVLMPQPPHHHVFMPQPPHHVVTPQPTPRSHASLNQQRQQKHSTLNAKAHSILKPYISDYLQYDLRILRHTDYDGTSALTNVVSSFDSEADAQLHCRYKYYTQGVGGSVFKLSRTIKHHIEGIMDRCQCPLYLPVDLAYHMGQWVVRSTIPGHSAQSLALWLQKCKGKGRRWACVHLYVLLPTSGHVGAVVLDLQENIGHAFDPHGAMSPPIYPVPGASGQTVRLHDLLMLHGVGRVLFPSLPDLVWSMPYTGKRHPEGLQAWIENGLQSGVPPWWCSHTSCKRCDSTDSRGRQTTTAQEDTLGMCMTLTMLTWVVSLRFQYWNMACTAVIIREVCDDFLQQNRVKSGLSDVQARAVLRRRILQWILRLYKYGKPGLGYLVGNINTRLCGIIDWSTGTVCLKRSTSSTSMHCESHMRTFYLCTKNPA